MNLNILRYKLKKFNLVNRLGQIISILGVIVLPIVFAYYSKPYLPEVLVFFYLMFIVVGVFWWKICEFNLNDLAVIIFVLTLLWVTLIHFLAGGRGLIGIDSYIETKYRSNEHYYITVCSRSRFYIPRHCVVPGYPEAEREANQIIKFLNLSIYSPLMLALFFYLISGLALRAQPHRK